MQFPKAAAARTSSFSSSCVPQLACDKPAAVSDCQATQRDRDTGESLWLVVEQPVDSIERPPVSPAQVQVSEPRIEVRGQPGDTPARFIVTYDVADPDQVGPGDILFVRSVYYRHALFVLGKENVGGVDRIEILQLQNGNQELISLRTKKADRNWLEDYAAAELCDPKIRQAAVDVAKCWLARGLPKFSLANAAKAAIGTHLAFFGFTGYDGEQKRKILEQLVYTENGRAPLNHKGEQRAYHCSQFPFAVWQTAWLKCQDLAAIDGFEPWPKSDSYPSGKEFAVAVTAWANNSWRNKKVRAVLNSMPLKFSSKWLSPRAQFALLRRQALVNPSSQVSTNAAT